MTTNPSPSFLTLVAQTIGAVNATFSGAFTALNAAITNTLTAANIVATNNLAVTGNETVGGTLGVTGATSLAALAAASLTVGGVPYSSGLGSNRIINGGFTVNQRSQVSNVALTAGAYGHDRWKAGVGGCTYTFTVALPDTTITITAGTLTQVIEASWIEGGIYTLSWAGTAQARVYQGAPAGAYAASPITTSALAAGTNTIVEFNPGTLTKVKFELGVTPTPFNRESPGKVVSDCHRYFQKFGGAPSGSDIMFQGSVTAAGLNFTTTLSYHTTMRVIPTVTIANNAGFIKSNLANAATPLFFPGLDSMALLFSAVAAGLVNWESNDATTYFTLNAEL